jgi:hypothetical protein
MIAAYAFLAAFAVQILTMSVLYPGWFIRYLRAKATRLPRFSKEHKRPVPEAKRTALLQRRGLFDFISPRVVFLAVLSYLLFVAFVIYLQQDPVAGFIGRINLGAVTLVYALNAFVLYRVLYGKNARRSPARDRSDSEEQYLFVHRRRVPGAQLLAQDAGPAALGTVRAQHFLRCHRAARFRGLRRATARANASRQREIVSTLTATVRLLSSCCSSQL